MQLIGKILLGTLLLLFGLATLGMGICAAAFTVQTNGFSLLLGLPATGVLGVIAVLIWRALQEAAEPSHVTTEENESAPASPHDGTSP